MINTRRHAMHATGHLLSDLGLATKPSPFVGYLTRALVCLGPLCHLKTQYHPALSFYPRPAAAASRRHKIFSTSFFSVDSIFPPLQTALFRDLWPKLAYAPRSYGGRRCCSTQALEKEVSTMELSTRFAILAQRLLPRPHGLCNSGPTMLHMSIRMEVSARAHARCLQYNRGWRMEQETVEAKLHWF